MENIYLLYSLSSRYILCVGLMLHCVLGYTQPQGYTFSHYTTENGLPQNSVKDIKFDQAGYCWLTTEMGLVRFDGRVFKTYGTSEIKGLKSDRIQYMNIENDPVMPVKAVGNLYAYSSEGQILSINSSGQNSSVPKLDNSKFLRTSYKGRVVTDKRLIVTIDSLNGNDVNVSKKWICGMGPDQAYYYDDRQLYHLKNGALKLISAKIQASYQSMFLMAPFFKEYLIRIFPQNTVQVFRNGILQNRHNKIFGALENDLDYRAGKFSLLSCEAGTYIYCRNSLYEITISKGKLICKVILNNLNIPNVTSLYFSPAKKKFYFGSGTGGLYVVQLNSFHYPDMPTQDSGPFSKIPSFYAQAKLNDSLLFSKNIVFPLHQKPYPLKLVGNNISAAIYNDQNAIYYQSDQYLCSYDWKSKKVAILHKLDSELRSIFYDSLAKSIVFFTEFKYGRIEQHAIAGITAYPDGIHVSNVFPYSENAFLLATHSGLKWYNSKKNQIFKSALDSAVIRTIQIDNNQRIWISTYGRGFYLWQDDKLHQMPLGPRQALKTVHSFIEDKRGYFWLPTNNGLFMTKKTSLIAYSKNKIKDVYFYMFDAQSGLKTNEFNGGCNPSYLWMKDSLLSIPSVNGLVWFSPNQLKPLHPDNGIFIDRVVINGRDTTLANNRLILPADFDMVSVLISSPYFGIRENIQMEYAIKKNSDTWLPLPENGEIVLRDISPGDYQITVRKRAQHMEDDSQQLKIQIRILPKFYNTWWFYVLVVLIIILTAFLITRQRVRILQQNSKMLQEQVDLRTKKLSEAIQELEVSENALFKSNQIKDKMITMILHDLRSPIRFISFISGHLLSKGPQLGSQELTEHLADLNHGAIALKEFTERFFKWAIMQQEDFKIKEMAFPLQEIFTEIENLYAQPIKANGNKLVILQTNVMCYTDQHVLAFIIRNLIDNANKNTHQGEITLGVNDSLIPLAIYVSDSGKGMTAEQIDLFFNRNREVGTDGIGSVLILQMLEKIGGQLDISSILEKGTRFSITLPNHHQYGTHAQGEEDQSGF